MEKNATDTYEDVNDSPVDYSKKYMERTTLPQNCRINSPHSECAADKEYRKGENEVDLFGDYAETDLDQPTDYSLRYAEDDTDEDEKQSAGYFPGSMQEDTIKTYCTEGTPYETPFNFSTATSMSDLRVEDLKDNDILRKIPKKIVTMEHKGITSFKQKVPSNCDNQQLSILKETKNLKNDIKHDEQILEKPINYYGEGTPASFSRVNSLNSLSSTVTTQNNIPEVTTKVPVAHSTEKSELEKGDHGIISLNNNELISESNSPSEVKVNSRVVDKEGKMVTFCGHDYYEQTPLMFSRSSSLGSLSGFDQHSIHDDRSSIISDFRTSGIVSPSELPDSPTQTVPPSPCNQKIQNTHFTTKVQEDIIRPPLQRLSDSKPQAAKTSVFEDDIATFKEESTPIVFSSATSLSSLTIDDEVKTSDLCKAPSMLEETNREDQIVKSTHTVKPNAEPDKDQEQVSDGDEDDEDILAACISMGMQNNRYSQSFKTANIQKTPHPESANITTRYPRNVGLSRLTAHVPVPTVSIELPSTTSKTNKPIVDAVVVPDTVHVYCTEDTPADISPVGSQSNLSALSMPSVPEDVEKMDPDKASEIECHRNDLSDESSNLSGEDEKILDECIQSGMPKIRQITPPPTNCIRFGKKPEIVIQKFNVCGTPSSSPVESNNKSSILNKPLCCKPIEQEVTFSDDSPNHSEDEAILSECIQSAMPKTRLCNLPPLRPPTGLQNIPSCTSNFRSQYPDHNESTVKKPVHFEDNFSLSEEEEDIILAQCIQSGMPKALNVSCAASVPALDKEEKCLKSINLSSPSYLTNKTYPTRTVALHTRVSVESDTSQRLLATTSRNLSRFSTKLTDVDAGQCGKHCDTSFFEKISAPCAKKGDNVNRNSIDMSFVRSRASTCRSPTFVIPDDDDDDESCRIVNKSILGPSRHSSVSSLSEDGSLGSIEEWALLEFCITPGMPRHKYRVQNVKPGDNAMAHGHDDCETIPEDNYSVCSYNSYVCKT